ncbi:MAG: glycine--tRNA ligase [Minisyncoccales bacterium]
MTDLMEKIVSLSKRRGFIYPGSEIYGGLANTYDYGPLGVELKNNLKRLWWRYFVQQREDMVGLDGGIILNPKVWQVSGHLEKFKDYLVECKKCHHRFRPDKLPAKTRKCPDCGGSLTEPRLFSGMFKIVIGPVEEEGLVTYLRPETAQNIFINFRNVLNSTRQKIPFGIAQIGKSFRNEITTGNFIFRTIEFEIMELEYFISPQTDWQKIFNDWLNYIYGFADLLGLKRQHLFNHELTAKERAHYSQRTIDIEYQFPFGQEELWAIAYRTDYDLARHQQVSKENLEYFDEQTKQKYLPHVIEPTFGLDRTFLAILCESYTEEKERVVLKLKPYLAPYQAAVFPLLANKPALTQLARQIYDNLGQEFHIVFDDRGNIGKRYYSQDEIGTPYCLTVDFKSLEQNDVTIRDRDTLKQERVKINNLNTVLREKLKLNQ